MRRLVNMLDELEEHKDEASGDDAEALHEVLVDAANELAERLDLT